MANRNSDSETWAGYISTKRRGVEYEQEGVANTGRKHSHTHPHTYLQGHVHKPRNINELQNKRAVYKH